MKEKETDEKLVLISSFIFFNIQTYSGELSSCAGVIIC